MTDLVERLRACENDPMWADHAEIPKLWCGEAADEIERLRRLCQDLADVQRQNEETYGKAADEIERLLKLVDTLYREKNSEREMYTNAIDRYCAEIERLPVLAAISVPVDQAILDKPLADIQFGKIVTPRAHSIWRRDDKMDWIKVTTVRELVALTEQEIMRAPNVGKSTIKAIKTVLAEHGLHLGMTL